MAVEGAPKEIGKIVLSSSLVTYQQTMVERDLTCKKCPDKPVCEPSSWAEANFGNLAVVVKGRLAGSENCAIVPQKRTI